MLLFTCFEYVLLSKQSLPWLLRVDSLKLRPHVANLDMSENDDPLSWMPPPFTFQPLPHMNNLPLPLLMPLPHPFSLPEPSAEPKSSVKIAIVPSKIDVFHADKKSDIFDVSTSHHPHVVKPVGFLPESATFTPRIDAVLDRYLKRAVEKAPKSILKSTEQVSRIITHC